MFLIIFFSVAAVCWLGMSLGALYHLRWAKRLPSLAALSTSQSPGAIGEVRCSVVIAARDEAERIEATVRRLLGQKGVAMEVIVVDDRSTDGTGEILRRLAAEDGRVRTERVEPLPDGWLGKCYACHRGANMAAGEWILFTDADSWLTPDLIRRAMMLAERDGVEHIALTMGVKPASLPARAWHIGFIMSLASYFSRTNRDEPEGHIGMGAFNLVRTTAYRKSGGYEALRMTVIDDIRLGLLVRRAGGRTRGFIGGDDMDCDWGVTARRMIHHMEKNYFAAAEFSVTGALCLSFGNTLLWLAGVIGPMTGTPAGIAAGLALLSLSLPANVVARRLGWSPLSAIAVPFCLPLMFYAILRSTVLTLRQGGIRWRDTFYPLAALRDGRVR